MPRTLHHDMYGWRGQGPSAKAARCDALRRIERGAEKLMDISSLAQHALEPENYFQREQLLRRIVNAANEALGV